MKITFFLPNLRVGGAEQVLRLIINALINQYPQYKIELCLSKYEGSIINKIDSRISIISFNKMHVRNCLIDLYYYFIENQPDIFISLLDYSNIIASSAHLLSRSKSKLILWEHSLTSLHSRGTISKFKIFRYLLIKLFYNHAYKIITVSDDVKQDLESNFKIRRSKLYIMNNPINFDEINKLSIYHNIDGILDINTQKYIISVGRLVSAKNYKLLINAYKIISNSCIHKLIIVGDGPEKNHLIDLIQSLNLNKSVILTGHIENPYPLIKNASLFVSSSSWEGWPVVLLESLSLGKFIVATNSGGGVKDILNNGEFGVLVETNNSKQLAEGISSILNGSTKFNQKFLRQRAKHFNTENAIKHFIEILNI